MKFRLMQNYFMFFSMKFWLINQLIFNLNVNKKLMHIYEYTQI
jgi:hypothetical protein